MSTVGVAMSSPIRQLTPEAKHELQENDQVAASEVFAQPRGGGAFFDVGVRQSRYTSPLPAPDDLDRYATHLVDIAERLLAAGEREQAHRHAIEREVMPRFYAGQRRGHVIGLILGLAYLAVVALAIDKGYPLIGTGAAAFGIAAVVWSLRRDPSGPNSQPVADHDAAARSASLGS